MFVCMDSTAKYLGTVMPVTQAIWGRFFFQAEDGIRDRSPSRGLGDVYKRQPGYDPVSVTGQVASGANVICFTTGRGSCFGCKPVPSLKLSTNSTMYEKMSEDMDINLSLIHI